MQGMLYAFRFVWILNSMPTYHKFFEVNRGSFLGTYLNSCCLKLERHAITERKFLDNKGKLHLHTLQMLIISLSL